MKVTNYFNYDHRFNGVVSRNNSTRIKHGVYVTNIDDRHSKRTHWNKYKKTSIELRIRKIDETRKYELDETKHKWKV